MGSDHIIVAIDGPAGSGKSSVSKEVAKRLGISYVDSGAIYRAITWLILRNRGAVERGAGFADDLAGASIDQRFLPDGA
ncbi:MAG TPA: (d)CMP kinase, partial [Spirochaetota bacterium]|nr:(d)CMP kinase [Spirochaetota bacterium]